MTLRDRAVLELQGGGTTVAAFEFKDGLEETTDVGKNYLVNGRGQYLREIWDQIDNVEAIPETDSRRRTGYSIDGGAGTVTRTFQFETGNEENAVLWGDQESDPGGDNVTVTDASGAEIHPYDRLDVFRYWFGAARTDSAQPAFLYFNQYSDATYANSIGTHAKPMPVLVREAQASSDLQEPSKITGSFTVTHIATFPEDAVNVTQKVTDALDELVDFA